MKIWHCVVVSILVLAVTGCRTDPNVAILERELRRKEDEIYRLRWKLEDMQDTSSCSDSWQPRPTEPDAGGPQRNDSLPSSGSLAPPAIELPAQPSSGVPDSLKPPPGSVMPEMPEVPEHLRGPSEPLPSNGAGPSLERAVAPSVAQAAGAGNPVYSPAEFPPVEPRGDSRRVQQIALDRAMTGGVVTRELPGGQGLLAVVEPRDADGRAVDAPAEMDLALLDPAVTEADGRARRVAKWDYTSDEVAKLFRRGESSRAIHLTMVLPNDRPKHHTLRLFVRYITSDGRILQDDMPIELSTPVEPSSRWTPTEIEQANDSRSAGSGMSSRTSSPASADQQPPLRTASRPHTSRRQRPIWSPDR